MSMSLISLRSRGSFGSNRVNYSGMLLAVLHVSDDRCNTKVSGMHVRAMYM